MYFKNNLQLSAHKELVFNSFGYFSKGDFYIYLLPSVCSEETTVSFGCFLIPGTRVRRRILAACLEQVWIWLAMSEDLGFVKQRAGFLA